MALVLKFVGKSTWCIQVVFHIVIIRVGKYYPLCFPSNLSLQVPMFPTYMFLLFQSSSECSAIVWRGNHQSGSTNLYWIWFHMYCTINCQVYLLHRNIIRSFEPWLITKVCSEGELHNLDTTNEPEAPIFDKTPQCA